MAGNGCEKRGDGLLRLTRRRAARNDRNGHTVRREETGAGIDVLPKRCHIRSATDAGCGKASADGRCAPLDFRNGAIFTSATDADCGKASADGRCALYDFRNSVISLPRPIRAAERLPRVKGVRCMTSGTALYSLPRPIRAAEKLSQMGGVRSMTSGMALYSLLRPIRAAEKLPQPAFVLKDQFCCSAAAVLLLPAAAAPPTAPARSAARSRPVDSFMPSMT